MNAHANVQCIQNEVQTTGAESRAAGQLRIDSTQGGVLQNAETQGATLASQNSQVFPRYLAGISQVFRGPFTALSQGFRTVLETLFGFAPSVALFRILLGQFAMLHAATARMATHSAALGMPRSQATVRSQARVKLLSRDR